MNPKQILLILKARWWLVLAVLVVGVAGTYVVSHFLPKKYTAATSLVVDVRGRDPIAAMLVPASMTTQEDIIKSDRVAQRVVTLLRLDQNPAVREQWREATGGRGRVEMWLGELLQKNLNVVPPRRDSTVLTIEYTAVDGGFAAAVANAYAQAYVDATVELRVEPAKQYARWFAEQGKSLRENLERAQARLSEFQQKKGLVAKDERLDAETAKLNELTSQLTSIQLFTVDQKSKERSGQDTLPEVLGNSVVSGLRSDIARKEAQLKDASVNLGENHPQYKSMQFELAALRDRLANETKHVTTTYTSTRNVSSDKERELRGAIERQKQKLLELRGERDQLSMMQRDVDSAQNASDSVAARFAQTSLESQANQTNVFLLSPAIEPLEPSQPKILRYTAMAVFFSLLAGLAAAFGLELLNRRVRCIEDLGEALGFPVLAVLAPDSPRRRWLLWKRTVPSLPAPAQVGPQ
jgi:polysaccharide biosynthesis transport protein